MRRSHPTILVIDDDADDLVLLQDAFKAARITSRVQVLTSGYEAIAYLNGEGKYADRSLHAYPDFVLTDLKMPGMDGFAVLEYLKRQPGSATIPAVILSGSQDNDDISKARLLGASSYHVKPSGATALRALIKVLLEYWMLCEVPAVDAAGRPLASPSEHKLGGRYPAAVSV